MRPFPLILTLLVAATAIAVFWSIRATPTENGLQATLLNAVNDDGHITVTETAPITIAFRVENLGTTALGPFHVTGVCDCDIVSNLPATIAPSSHAELAFRVRPLPAGATDGEVVITDSSGSNLSVPFSIVNESPVPRVEAAPQILLSIVRGDSVVQDCRFVCIEEADHEPFVAAAQVVGCPILETLAVKIVETVDEPLRGTELYVRRVYTLRLEGERVHELSGITTEIALQSSRGGEALYSIPLTGVVHDPLVVVPSIVTLPNAGESKRIQIISRGDLDVLPEQLTLLIAPLDAGILLTPCPDFVADGGPVIAEYLVERTEETTAGDIEVFFEVSQEATARLLVHTIGE